MAEVHSQPGLAHHPMRIAHTHGIRRVLGNRKLHHRALMNIGPYREKENPVTMREYAWTLLAIALWTLAVARITRVVTDDEITFNFRVWLIKKVGTESATAYFIQCPWCVSMWLAFITAPYVILLLELSWWWLPLLALAASHITGLLAGLSTDEDIDISK